MPITISRPRNVTTGVPIAIDVSALRELARDLKRVGPELARELQAGMKEAADVVASEAERRADFSTRIPGSIRRRTSLANFKVTAGGDAAPDAAPIENRGKGHVRHPVFGDREVWTEKNSPPAFLAPALDAKTDQVVEIVDTATMRAVSRALRLR